MFAIFASSPIGERQLVLTVCYGQLIENRSQYAQHATERSTKENTTALN